MCDIGERCEEYISYISFTQLHEGKIRNTQIDAFSWLGSKLHDSN